MHRQQLELLLIDDLLLQGHWGKEDALAQHTSFNTLNNWGHKTPTQSKSKRNQKEKFKGSWPETHTIHSVTIKQKKFCKGSNSIKSSEYSLICGAHSNTVQGPIVSEGHSQLWHFVYMCSCPCITIIHTHLILLILAHPLVF